MVCLKLLPGTSGVLSPFGKIDGLYFNNSKEPESFEFNFKQDVRKIMEEDDVEYIEIKADNEEDYAKILDMLAEFNKDCITVSGTSRDNYTVIVEEFKDLDADVTGKEENNDK